MSLVGPLVDPPYRLMAMQIAARQPQGAEDMKGASLLHRRFRPPPFQKRSFTADLT